jgi:pyruvate, water dikinase
MSALPFILWLEECDGSHVAAVGGKCAGLGEMIKAGVNVPPGFAITTSAHRTFLDQSGLDARISHALAGADLDDVHSLQAVSGEIRALIASAPVPEPVERAIRAAYDELAARSGQPEAAVAVRSSAVAEDLAGASFAGQLETFLGVRGAEEVVRHTLRAWAGLLTERALAYRKRMGLSSEHALMSVGVQQMLEPRAAGVMFTLNPLNGDPSKVAVEASWGLGESVARGDVDPDRYLVDKVTLQIVQRTIARKTLERRFDVSKREVVVVQLSEERAARACLSDDEVLELAEIGKRIERFYGSVRDIEWALVESATGGSSFQILQSRPETVWSGKRSEKPILERKGSAVEYVLAELMSLSGREPGREQKAGP